MIRSIYISLLAFGLLASPTLFAQTYTFSILAGETNNPIAYAHIQVEGTLYGAVSDGDGRCKIQIQPEDSEGRLVVSFMGFQSAIIPIPTLKPKEPNVIRLQESEIQLAEFQVIDIGMSPQEFLQKTIELADKTFYTKDYTGLATYEEEIVEDGEATFAYSMDILMEAQGVRSAKGKNKYIGNDEAYLIKVNELAGSQKYSALNVAEMIGYTFPFDKPKGEDIYFTKFLTIKNNYERFLFIDPNMILKEGWFFEDLYAIDNETYVKVTHESGGFRVSFDIDRNTFHIRSIELIAPSRNGRNKMSPYARGDIDFRIDYFKIDGKSYLKSVAINHFGRIVTDKVIGTKQSNGKLVFHRLVEEKPDKNMKIDEEFIGEKIYK